MSCIRCGVELTEANWEPTQRKNYINKCRDCIKVEKRNYAAAWNARHPGVSNARAKKHKEKLRKENPIKARAREAYSDAKKRAAKQGMRFELTAKDVFALMLDATVCPYLNWPLTHTAGKAKTLASLDRIDSADGYVKGNVQVVSYLANMMKSSATKTELLLFAEGVRRVFK